MRRISLLLHRSEAKPRTCVNNNDIYIECIAVGYNKPLLLHCICIINFNAMKVLYTTTDRSYYYI